MSIVNKNESCEHPHDSYFELALKQNYLSGWILTNSNSKHIFFSEESACPISTFDPIRIYRLRNNAVISLEWLCGLPSGVYPCRVTKKNFEQQIRPLKENSSCPNAQLLQLLYLVRPFTSTNKFCLADDLLSENLSILQNVTSNQEVREKFIQYVQHLSNLKSETIESLLSVIENHPTRVRSWHYLLNR